MTDTRNVLLLGQLHYVPVQFLSLRNLDLRPHQVDAGHHFGNRVLYLNAWVHLDEVPLFGIHVVQELHGAGVVVLDVLSQFHGRCAKLAAHSFIQRHAGGDFHNLLVPPLHGAIALVQVQHVAVLVTQNLHFNVLGTRYVFLKEHCGITKRPISLAASFIEQPLQILGLVYHAHAASAAAKGRLDDQREPNVFGHLHRLGAGGDGVICAGQNRHTSRLGQRACLGLVTHLAQQLRAWPHKGKPSLGASLGKVSVLRQKSVAGMDVIHPALLSHLHDALNVQIRAHRALAHTHQIGFIRLKTVHSQTILLRVDCHGAHVHLRGGAENADGDLAAVGRHQFHRPLCRRFSLL